jgi:hypothetical protein
MNQSRLLTFSIVSVGLMIAGCTDRAKLHDLSELNRVETLWKSPNGTAAVALYERPVGLSKNPEFIVCETGKNKVVVRPVPYDAFAWVDGDTLIFYDTAKREMPGWYKMARNHNLNWWQRTFGDQILGEIESTRPPEKFEMPSAKTLFGGVFSFKDGNLSRVADEERLQDLWDVRAEGLVYVAPPGIAVRYTSHLPSVCR